MNVLSNLASARQRLLEVRYQLRVLNQQQDVLLGEELKAQRDFEKALADFDKNYEVQP